ncbi:ATP-binding cassette domain-containing protein [Gammaproteobacteria bacterium]|nr:ATP-binding cassette domain-containing protein [Gammaproteobacteria bacterium]
MQHRLSAISPLLLMRNVPLQEGATYRFGRDSEQCNVVVAGGRVSRLHASLTVGEDQLLLRDARSSNGTFINGERVGDAGQVLKPGDEIAFGSDSIHFRYLVEHEQGEQEWMLPLAEGGDLIGSAADCQVQLESDEGVAKHHLRIQRNGTKVTAIALDEAFFFSNGQRCKRADLDTFDVLTLGSTSLVLEIAVDGQVSLHRQNSTVGRGSRLEGVGLSVVVAGGKKLLDDITVSIQPGELVAVLGPSGSGKTTLIKALCGIQKLSSGVTFLDGTPVYRNPDLLTDRLGFVPQDDIVLPELTVTQSLEYMAKLRLSHSGMSRFERRELVDTIIATLGLSPFSDIPVKRLSGGQRKRVSIGIELITQPGLLCLDEPTAALDPASEEQLIRHFRALADHGTTVLMTTHVLYSLEAFDKIIFIVDGRLAFCGSPDQALGYFADYYDTTLARHLDIFREVERERSEQSTGLGGRFDRAFRASNVWSDVVVAPLSRNARRVFLADSSGLQRTSRGSWWRDLRLRPGTVATLASRHARSRLGSLPRVALYALVPTCLALATLLLGSPADIDATRVEATSQFDQLFSVQTSRWNNAFSNLLGQLGVQQNASPTAAMSSLLFESPATLPVSLGKLLMFCLTALFGGALVACTEIAAERPLLQRESITSYGMLEYLVGKVPFLIVVAVGQMAIYLGICLMFADEFSGIDIVSTYALLVLLSLCAMMLGLLVSALDFSGGRSAVIVVLALLLPQLILSGGLAPDFYLGAGTLTQSLMNVLPARWGFEGFLNTSLGSHVDAQPWIERVVLDVMGFSLAPGTLSWNVLVIGLQSMIWFILACSVLVLTRGRS